jgi:hypothetical protein
LFSAKPICVEFYRRTSAITIVGDLTARWAKQHHAVRRGLSFNIHVDRSPRSLCSAGYTTFTAPLHDNFLRPTGLDVVSVGHIFVDDMGGEPYAQLYIVLPNREGDDFVM